MNLMTVKQTADKYMVFSESALRWLLFHRNQNGLDKAVVKVGKRVLIDDVSFSTWLECKREVV